MRWTLLLVAIAACGPKSAPPPEISGSAEHAPVNDSPAELLAALAEAARTDDPGLLDPLIHPEHGLWIWTQPGAAVSPTVLLKPDGKPPSARLAGSGLNEYWLEELWGHVAGPIDRGLKVMDSDPPDRHAAVYGTCDTDEAPATRAWLITEDLAGYYDQLLADADVTLAPVMRTGLVHFRNWGLDVWLARDRDRWWVAHVMVWTPCDA